jgi:hypothetical protein
MALLLAGCASKVPYDPFKVPPEQVRSRVKTVALTPMDTPRDLEDPAAATKLLDLVEVELRQGGLTIVGVTQFKAIWDSMTAGMSGFYDPVTGRRDEEKVKSVRLQVYQELKTKFNVDAVLFSRVNVVGAELDHDTAKWDGTSEGAGRKKFWKAVLGESHSGTVPALSLQVFLFDTDDIELYVNSGGIQVLEKVGPGGTFDPVPREQLFSKEERNTRAVRLALNPLLGRTTKT